MTRREQFEALTSRPTGPYLADEPKGSHEENLKAVRAFYAALEGAK